MIGAAGLLLMGCAAQPRPGAEPRRGGPLEYQDARTGVTVTRADKPLIFALDTNPRSGQRDYISVVAAATNRTGTLRYLLLVYVWSSQSALTASRPLVVTADEQRLSFDSVPMVVVEADLSAPIPAPSGAGALWAAYATDLTTLASLAAAQHLALQVSDDPRAQRFALWDDQRAALGRLVRYLNGE